MALEAGWCPANTANLEPQTLVTPSNLATSLSEQGKYAEALEIEREILVSRTRLLGVEHEDTLASATNLAGSLSRLGRKMAAEKILRKTLALCRRTLGPDHKLTQLVLQYFRVLGLTAR